MNRKLHLRRHKRVLKRRKVAKIMARVGPKGLEKWKLKQNMKKARRRVARKSI